VSTSRTEKYQIRSRHSKPVERDEGHSGRRDQGGGHKDANMSLVLLETSVDGGTPYAYGSFLYHSRHSGGSEGAAFWLLACT